jgi:diguanylate cyclase (GGDEF)-like protein
VIQAPLDVLEVGGPPGTADELRACGLAVESAASLAGAVTLLRARPVALAVVGGAYCGGAEPEVFAALREAGAASLLVLYPPSLAWRAARAHAWGADDAIAVPAFPGALGRSAERLVRAVHAPAALEPALPPALATGPAGSVSLEAIVADIAVVNRSIDDLDRLMEQVIQVFSRRSGATRCSLLLLDETRRELHLRRWTGLPESLVPVPVPVGSGLAGQVVRSGMPLLVADIGRLRGAPLRTGTGEDAVPYKTPSCLLLPLRAARGVIGVVCLADKQSARPFDESDLGPLRFLADQSAVAIENAVQFRRMRDLAAIDELTGLSNRRQFQATLEREIQRARRYDRQLTLALFDVDHFKKYNDSCGHPAGDRALAAVGEILRGSLREVDLVARYGGEEFAVILPETAARPGAASSPFPFLERLRHRVEAAVFPGQDKMPLGKLTLSGGLACFPDDADTLEALVREADRALYVSKARGRNTITYRGKPLSD